jgi:hypothetical protein
MHIRSCVLDLSRGFVFASAILRLAVAMSCRPLAVCRPIGLGLVADSSLVLGVVRAVAGRFFVALGGSFADADAPSVDADSSLRRCLHDLAKVVSSDGILGHASRSVA